MESVIEGLKREHGAFDIDYADYAVRYLFDGSDAELNAYKLAYKYRDSAHGVVVRNICGSVWVTEVFTALAKGKYWMKGAK